MQETQRKPETILGKALAKVCDLIEHPDRWCRHSIAQDAGCQAIGNPLDARACRWCIMGACFKVAGYCGCDECEQCATGHELASDLLDAIRAGEPEAEEHGLDVWNDEESWTTHADVLAAITLAIHKAEGWKVVTA